MILEVRRCSRSASPAETIEQMFARFHPDFGLVIVGLLTILRTYIWQGHEGMGHSCQNPVSTNAGWIRRWTNELRVRATREIRLRALERLVLQSLCGCRSWLPALPLYRP